MRLFHKHNWELIDKVIIPPNKAITSLKNCSELTGQRIILGYVVLTFKCACGDVKVIDK
jgi:hypothetical protein